MKNTDWLTVDKMRQHPRKEEGRLWKVERNPDTGNLDKTCLFSVVVNYPRDGAGRLKVGVSDWSTPYPHDNSHWYGWAGGYGYDKLTAALCDAVVMGQELGDHSDHKNRPTLKAFVDSLVYGTKSPDVTYIWTGDLSL